MSIIEVARTAGLSHSTVSRVINNRPGVAPETAEAVHRAMELVGYTPPAKRRGRRPIDRIGVATGNVALLMVGTDAMFARAPVTAAVFHAVEQAIAERGFNLIVAQVGDEQRLPPDVARGRIDGLLLHGYAPPPRVGERLKRHPSVWLLSQRSMRGYWGDRLSPDNEAIGRLAAEHLVSRGHRRVAYVFLSATHMGFRARAEAFAETAAELGARAEIIAEDPFTRSTRRREEFDSDELLALVDHLLALDPVPTGVFVPRDRFAVKFYRAARQRGVVLGRDLEVVSCDNEPILDALDPRPATMDVRADIIGRRAVEQLVWRMSHPNEPTRSTVTVEPRLIVPAPQEEPTPAPAAATAMTDST